MILCPYSDTSESENECESLGELIYIFSFLNYTVVLFAEFHNKYLIALKIFSHLVVHGDPKYLQILHEVLLIYTFTL